MIYKINRFSYHTILSTASFIVMLIFLNCASDSTTGIGTPVLISPEDGAAITQNPPVFVWHRVEDAVEYNLQVADGPFSAFHTLIIDISCLSDTSYSPIGMIDSGTYYWRAQAMAGG